MTTEKTVAKQTTKHMAENILKIMPTFIYINDLVKELNVCLSFYILVDVFIADY